MITGIIRLKNIVSFMAIILFLVSCGKSEESDNPVAGTTNQQFDMTDKPYDAEAEKLSLNYRQKSAAVLAQLNRGIEYAEANGIEKLIEILKNPDAPGRSRFVQGDYYIWIFKTDFKTTAVVVAHPINKAINDRDFFEIKDADGKLFIKDIMRITATKGKGWVSYSWAHPRLKKAMPKLTYSVKFGDYILSDGFYLED